MSLQYDGIEIEKLIKCWPFVAPNLPPNILSELHVRFESILKSNKEELASKLTEFVQIMCDHKPRNLGEYMAYCTIATAIELLNSPSILFRSVKSQFTAHTFNTNVEMWCHDHKKVDYFIIVLIQSNRIK